MKQLELFPETPFELGDRVLYNGKGRAKRISKIPKKRPTRGIVKDFTKNRLWILVLIDDYGLISCSPESLEKLRS